MAEESVWRGTSSQLKNICTFLLCAVLIIGIVAATLLAAYSDSAQLNAAAPFLLFALLIPLVLAFMRYLRIKSTVYELTTERLKITKGIFNKVTDTLELYRVKDLETRQPFWSRMCGLENVQINTSDLSTPFVHVEAVPISLGLGDKIRNAVENVRMQKRVREIDIE